VIRIYFQGRLGNQLFQYAFALYASKKLNTKFIIRIKKKDGYQLDCFKMSGIFKYFYLGEIFLRVYDFTQRLLKLKKYYIPNIDEDWNNKILKNNYEYIGYFQDSKFSADIKSTLLSHLEIREKYKKKFFKAYSRLIAEKYAVLHIRFGDYTNHVVEINNKKLNYFLPKDWFYKSIEYAQIGNRKLVVISDDIELAKKHFKDLTLNLIFPEGDKVTHFQFLLYAEICIISNSTFAWWGAYLNTVPNKKVYAPYNWLGHREGFEFPKGIMTKEFIWV
jgi:hypothetical protein